MLTYWRGAELDIAPHAASRSQVLRAMEEVQGLQAAMDEHTARCLALAASPYAKPVEEALANLLVSLRIATDTLDAWFGVQRGWLHLQAANAVTPTAAEPATTKPATTKPPLFAAADIVTAMPAEARRFAAIDRVWRQTMMAAAARPNLLRFCASGGRILETMRESARHLDGILRNLAELLEAKRLAFPRFFFLADDELLQLLSRARDPRAVQPHLHKCFEGVVRLVFAGDALRADGGAELAPPARAAAGDEEGSGELDEEEAEPGAD
ncbi:dynein heavy chain, N-terminal region 2-domain-containing protein, partial [Pavlovales sp. CCMP2436]